VTEDEDIININQENLSAFQQPYTKYYVGLCVYAKQFTKTKEIAEEVVQDVFLNVWEQKGNLNITGSLKAYLFASVRNRCLDYLKHLQVVHKFNEKYSHLLNEAEDLYFFSRESGESLLIADQLKKEVSEAIDSLPDQCRKIFLMSRFEGLKHQEIANSLGITKNTVQHQVSIALGKLRESLKKHLILFVPLLKFLIV